MNMQAIEKINTEMQKNPTDQYTEIVGQYIIDRCTSDPDGALVAKEGKTLAGAMTAVMERAKKAKAKAEQDLAAMKVAQEEAQAIANQEKKNLAEQVQALQKKLAVASSSEMTIFKLHFEQGQTSINKMTECIEKMMEAGDGEGAGKLRNALAALLTTTLEVLK